MDNTVKDNTQEVVVDVRDVKKFFKSYQDKANSFKERFLHPSRNKHENVEVLKGISFQVHRGEAVGLIGKNGCGKSTTLKLLTRILYPTEGQIIIKGRVSSLIELGAGFHPDMTGRENIYTNASIFGLTRKEIDNRLADIIRFSELEEFIDNPVRTYSSGMYMRLAFAVAINVDADVLLIDEILAVGDSAFQKKCFERLKEIKANGTTIVIVSHSMDQMYKICDKLIWIEEGLVKKEGVPKFVGEEYLAAMECRRLDRVELENLEKKEELEKKIEESNDREEKEELAKQKQQIEKNKTLKDITKFYRTESRRGGNGKCVLKRVDVLDENNNATDQLEKGKKYSIKLVLKRPNIPLQDVIVAIGITREDGVYCYGNYTQIDGKNLSKDEKIIKFIFENELLSGMYMLDLWVQSTEHEIYDEIIGLQSIKVINKPTHERGILSMNSHWE